MQYKFVLESKRTGGTVSMFQERTPGEWELYSTLELGEVEMGRLEADVRQAIDRLGKGRTQNATKFDPLVNSMKLSVPIPDYSTRPGDLPPPILSNEDISRMLREVAQHPVTPEERLKMIQAGYVQRESEGQLYVKPPRHPNSLPNHEVVFISPDGNPWQAAYVDYWLHYIMPQQVNALLQTAFIPEQVIEWGTLRPNNIIALLKRSGYEVIGSDPPGFYYWTKDGIRPEGDRYYQPELNAWIDAFHDFHKTNVMG